MFNSNKKAFKKFDYTLFITTIILCVFGLIMLYSATLSFNTLSYIKSQSIATAIGFAVLILLVLLDYQFLGKIYIPIYVVCNLLLVAVLIWGFGEDQWGARSWLKIGVIFQPSEFVKVGLIISLSKFIDNRKENINEPVTLLIDVVGPKVVTAGDIITGLDVEIVNKDHYLATVNEDGRL